MTTLPETGAKLVKGAAVVGDEVTVGAADGLSVGGEIDCIVKLPVQYLFL